MNNALHAPMGFIESPGNDGLLCASIAAGAIVFMLAQTRLRSTRQAIETVYYDQFPQVDLVLGIVATGTILFIVDRPSITPSLLKFLNSPNGTAAYGAALSAFAALLGFSVTVLAVVCAIVPSGRFTSFVSDEQYAKFWNAFTITIRTLGLCTIFSLAAIFLNTSDHLREWLFLAFVLIVSVTTPGVIRAALTLEVLVRGVRDAALRQKGERRKNLPVK